MHLVHGPEGAKSLKRFRAEDGITRAGSLTHDGFAVCEDGPWLGNHEPCYEDWGLHRIGELAETV